MQFLEKSQKIRENIEILNLKQQKGEPDYHRTKFLQQQK